MGSQPFKNFGQHGAQAFQPGTSSGFEHAILFTRWAASLDDRLDAQKVKDHWDVSRATAYRWVRAYRDAMERIAA